MCRPTVIGNHCHASHFFKHLRLEASQAAAIEDWISRQAVLSFDKVTQQGKGKGDSL